MKAMIKEAEASRAKGALVGGAAGAMPLAAAGGVIGGGVNTIREAATKDKEDRDYARAAAKGAGVGAAAGGGLGLVGGGIGGFRLTEHANKAGEEIKREMQRVEQAQRGRDVGTHEP